MLKRHLIKRTFAGGVVIVTGGLPVAAHAMRIGGGSGAGHAARTAATLPINSYSSRALHPYSPAGAASIVRVSSPSGGFDWGDAGIGAAGGAMLVGAGVLGARMTRRRRARTMVVS
jgi:hypothetical protein